MLIRLQCPAVVPLRLGRLPALPRDFAQHEMHLGQVSVEPRKLLNVIGQPLEMKRSGKQTFCCGAGGAHMWMEERGRPINEERAREATETGAETLAVACPFWTVMLDDGVRAVGPTFASPMSPRRSWSR